jgi:signal transduction histidine kinase
LRKDCEEPVPPVKANAKRLETVFHNLLSNAIHALAHQGGEIRLCVEQTASEVVKIAISDNGPGIPADLQSNMFNPGVSGREGGLGIGLWLVETFIHQFDGRLDFTSSEGEGTTFLITLQSVNQNN